MLHRQVLTILFKTARLYTATICAHTFKNTLEYTKKHDKNVRLNSSALIMFL